jgi:O-antigen/teichoic acid export membrane protein
VITDVDVSDRGTSPQQRGATGVVQCIQCVFLCFLWPASAFLNASTAVLAIGLGVLVIALGVLPAFVSRTRSLLSPALFVPLGFGVLTLGASVGQPALDTDAIVYFALVVLPLTTAVAFGIFPSVRQIRRVAEPLVYLYLLTPWLVQDVNRIGRGHVIWIAMLCLVIDTSPTRWRRLRVAFCGLAFVLSSMDLRSLGPLVACAVSLSLLVLQRKQPLTLRRTRHTLPLKLALFTGGAIASYTAVRSVLGELDEVSSGSGVRLDAWLQIVGGSPFGAGAVRLNVDTADRVVDLRHAHNYLLDAYALAGLLGLAMLVVLTVVAVRRALRARNPNLPLLAGIVTVHLMSGGLLFSPALWMSLLALYGWHAPRPRRPRGSRPTSDDDPGPVVRTRPQRPPLEPLLRPAPTVIIRTERPPSTAGFAAEPAPGPPEPLGSFGLLASSRATLATSLTTIVLAMVAGIVIARELEPEGRGRLAVFVVLPALMTRFALCGLDDAIIRAIAREPGILHNAVRWCARFSIAVGALVGVLACLYVVAFNSHDHLWTELLFLALIPPLSLLQSVHLAVLVGRRDVGEWNAARALQPVSYALLVLAFAVTSEVTIATLLGCQALSNLLSLVYARSMPAFANPRYGASGAELGRSLLRFGLSVQPARMASEIGGRIDILALSWMATKPELGAYAVASSLALAPGGLYSAQTSVSLARMSAADPSLVHDVGRKEIRRLMPLFVAVGIGAAALAPFAISLLYGSAYDGAHHPAQVLLLGSIAYGYTMFASARFRAIGKPFAVVGTEVTALVVLAVALPLLIPRMGPTGAAVATSLGYSIGALALAVMWRRSGHEA